MPHDDETVRLQERHRLPDDRTADAESQRHLLDGGQPLVRGQLARKNLVGDPAGQFRRQAALAAQWIHVQLLDAHCSIDSQVEEIGS